MKKLFLLLLLVAFSFIFATSYTPICMSAESINMEETVEKVFLFEVVVNETVNNSSAFTIEEQLIVENFQNLSVSTRNVDDVSSNLDTNREKMICEVETIDKTLNENIIIDNLNYKRSGSQDLEVSSAVRIVVNEMTQKTEEYTIVPAGNSFI